MRIDVYLKENGYSKSRSKAVELIENGWVIFDGQIVKKPSENVDLNIEHTVEIKSQEKYVGRGGLKLECAIEFFGIDVNEKRMIDVGASTGGFTNCLLEKGAGHVTAVDSGRGQLDLSLLKNNKVVSVEGYNARNLSIEDFGMFDGAVMDVSFISQTLIIPALAKLIKEDGFFITLVKPQFEAGRQAIGKKGIVKNPADREFAINKVLQSAIENNLSLKGVINSPILGGDGNHEYLACFIKDSNNIEKRQQKFDIRQLCRE